jgi:hypothetical protein
MYRGAKEQLIRAQAPFVVQLEILYKYRTSFSLSTFVHSVSLEFIQSLSKLRR